MTSTNTRHAGDRPRHETAPRAGAGRALLLVLLALASFSAAAAGIRRLAPEPNAWFFTERFAAFRAQKDRITHVFIGSSHFRSAIDPLLFDKLTAEAGHPSRSFNFSMPGIHLPEIDYVVRRIGALRPARLEWVVLEPWIKVQLDGQNLRKPRLIYFHDLPATMLALKFIHYQPEPEDGRLVQYQRHVQHFLYRQANQGLALWLIDDLQAADSPARTRLMETVAAGRGFFEREGSGFARGERRSYQRKLREFPSIFRRSSLEPELARALVPMLREVEAMGARPAFLFAPSLSTPYRLNLPDDAPATAVIRLDDAGRHPELFALENRYDMGHTNTRGARLTTAAAARALLRITGKDGH